MATMIDSPLFGNLFGTRELRAIFSDQMTVQKWLDVEARRWHAPRKRWALSPRDVLRRSRAKPTPSCLTWRR